MTPQRIGLVVNPAAGIGGRLGWHGSDTPAATARHGPAGGRAARALAVLRGGDGSSDLIFLVAAGDMGADAVAAAELPFRVVYDPPGARTAAADTRLAVIAMREAGASLVLFVGGDGTARDVCSAVGLSIPVVGIPAGVKMHSGVFGRTPEAGAAAVRSFLSGRAATTRVDVVDLDEVARERGDLTTRLYGQLAVPRSPEMQRGKVSLDAGGGDAVGIAAELKSYLKPDHGYLFGPGTTVQSVGAALGWELSLLGVDLVFAGRVELDVSADAIHRALGTEPCQVIVSPIGGQGMVLGRGNQPIDDTVLGRLAPEDLLIVCLPEKLAALRGELYLDTPDLTLNQRFAGVHRVITGHRRQAAVTLR